MLRHERAQRLRQRAQEWTPEQRQRVRQFMERRQEPGRERLAPFVRGVSGDGTSVLTVAESVLTSASIEDSGQIDLDVSVNSLNHAFDLAIQTAGVTNFGSTSGATTALQKQDAELALRTAELALQAAERDLADHRLTAPIAGACGM